MNLRPRTWYLLWLGIGAIAIGIKFPTYWNQWVYFPALPNLLDSVWLIGSGTVLVLLSFGKEPSLKPRVTEAG